MNGLRFWILVLLAWLIVLIAIEHPAVSIALRLNAYIFVAVTVIMTLIMPKLKQPQYAFLLGGLTLSFVIVEVFQSREFGQVGSFYLITTYTCAVVLTGLIARRVSQRIADFEDVVSQLTFSHIGTPPTSLEEAQSVMYQELQRARRFERPLSVVMLRLDRDSMQAELPRIVRDVQRSLMKEYVLAKVARSLDSSLEKFNPIALRDDCFVAILPETKAGDAEKVAARLRDAVEKDLNVQLHSGTASIPGDAITFESLLEQAEQRIISDESVRRSVIGAGSQLSNQEIPS